MNVIDILHGCRLFAKIPPEDFARLAAISRLASYGAGHTVFRDGDDCPGIFVLGRGNVRVFKTAPSGKEHVLHVVEPGGTFAEVAAMGGFACPANAEAISDSTCALIPGDRFNRLLAERHQLCLGLVQGMSGWVHHLVGLLEDIVLRDATGRVSRYLLSRSQNADHEIELPALKRHIASHLNLTSETFSRVLRRLAQQGVVVETSGKLRLRDADRLKKLAAGVM